MSKLSRIEELAAGACPYSKNKWHKDKQCKACLAIEEAMKELGAELLDNVSERVPLMKWPTYEPSLVELLLKKRDYAMKYRRFVSEAVSEWLLTEAEEFKKR